MTEYVIGPADQIPEGGRLIVELAGRSIGVFNVSGRLFAVRNRCPHQGGPLCAGVVVSWLESPRPGVYHFDPDRPLIECPWHAWTFDLATGQSWFDPQRTRVKPYPVAVRDDVDATTASDTSLVKGPYVAEVLPVRLKQKMIVVEVRS
jgi:3-phenylpropionate/trans-cinnamate dioxygenase ferredoxin subunit